MDLSRPISTGGGGGGGLSAGAIVLSKLTVSGDTSD